MSAPAVSVVLPTRNRAPLVGRAIASVLTQTFTDLELIVVDDGSTDATPQLLAALTDSRVRIIRRDGGHGPGAARNAGIAVARGELVAFQDDDDCWVVHKLERQVEALRAARPGTGWCLGGYVSLRPDGAEYIGGDEYFRHIEFGHRGSRLGDDFSLIATPAWLVRRDLLMQAGPFDERLRSYEDFELALRLHALSDCVHVDEPLSIQDHVAGGLASKVHLAHAAAMRIIMEKHDHLWARQRDVLARHWYFIGWREGRYAPAPAGRRELWRSLHIEPLALRTWAALARSYLPRRKREP